MSLSFTRLLTTARATDDKKKGASSPATSVASPGPVVNQLDDSAREAFATGRPLEDSPDLQQCKHCKKSVLKTAAKAHIAACLKVKKEKAQRKKEAREARERAKEAAREEEARKADDEEKDDDSDDDDKKGKKAVKKTEDGKGKKRKAEGEADKGPKTKKKKDEPKAKVPKPKGTRGLHKTNVPQELTLQFRACRCRATVWCHLTQRSALCAFINLQKSLHGCQARCRRKISAI
jgi:SAGA-associated factor 73